MNLLSTEEVAACIVNTEPYALKDVDPEVLNHLIQYAAMLGAEKTNPKREPLTEKDIIEAVWRRVALKIIAGHDITPDDWIAFARDIEAAHCIK